MLQSKVNGRNSSMSSFTRPVNSDTFASSSCTRSAIACTRGAPHLGSFSSIVHTTRGLLAEQYLATGHRSLTDISQLLGFAAPSAFSRWFAQRYGTTPTEWRRAALDGNPEAHSR